VGNGGNPWENRFQCGARRAVGVGRWGSMGKFLWRSKEVARITVRAPAVGSRAVFLVEADGRR